jgi:hypothetical protein
MQLRFRAGIEMRGRRLQAEGRGRRAGGLCQPSGTVRSQEMAAVRETDADQAGLLSSWERGLALQSRWCFLCSQTWS